MTSKPVPHRGFAAMAHRPPPRPGPVKPAPHGTGLAAMAGQVAPAPPATTAMPPAAVPGSGFPQSRAPAPEQIYSPPPAPFHQVAQGTDQGAPPPTSTFAGAVRGHPALAARQRLYDGGVVGDPIAAELAGGSGAGGSFTLADLAQLSKAEGLPGPQAPQATPGRITTIDGPGSYGSLVTMSAPPAPGAGTTQGWRDFFANNQGRDVSLPSTVVPGAGATTADWDAYFAHDTPTPAAPAKPAPPQAAAPPDVIASMPGPEGQPSVAATVAGGVPAAGVARGGGGGNGGTTGADAPGGAPGGGTAGAPGGGGDIGGPDNSSTGRSSATTVDGDRTTAAPPDGSTLSVDTNPTSFTDRALNYAEQQAGIGPGNNTATGLSNAGGLFGGTFGSLAGATLGTGIDTYNENADRQRAGIPGVSLGDIAMHGLKAASPFGAFGRSFDESLAGENLSGTDATGGLSTDNSGPGSGNASGGTNGVGESAAGADGYGDGGGYSDGGDRENGRDGFGGGSGSSEGGDGEGGGDGGDGGDKDGGRITMGGMAKRPFTGKLRGPGTAKSDSIPSRLPDGKPGPMLSNGERVMPVEVEQYYGKDVLDQMTKTALAAHGKPPAAGSQ